MRLKSNVIRELAKMIKGSEPYTNFPDRSDMNNNSTYDFFTDINLTLSGPNYSYWESEDWSYTEELLKHYNKSRSSDSDLPSKQIKCIIEYLLDPIHFISSELNQLDAIESVNRILKSQKLFVELDKNTANVALRKYPKNNIQTSYISTYKGSIKPKNLITSSPPTFDVYDDILNSKDKVFIVHGRDDFAKEMTAQFLKKLGLEPIILHEQPNRGRTIIEKFEDHSSDAKYAVILLTPDDVGGLKSDPHMLSPRARQNVVFEMGHFFGMLKRGNVCALLYPEVERPSDIDGIVYIPWDPKGDWKRLLARELEAAGLKLKQKN